MAGACIILLLPPKVIDAAIRPQQVTLGDGSRIDLDAGTVVKIPRQPWAHSITLVKGDAVFDVVHDESRPFTVHTPITTITDVGTRFLVRSRPDSSTVAVFEGEVAVTPPQGPAQRLTAQQAVEIRASGATKTLAPMNERGETAWRQGRIVFKDTPLSEVAARLSRYSPRPVLMGTPTLAGLKVSGSFAIDNGDDALGALEQVLPIRARRLDDRIVLEPVGRTQPPTRTPR
nr:FecR domain-containing protein [Magnetospirillum aberrantis]